MSKKNRFISLRTRAVIILIVAIVAGAATFGAVRGVGNFFVWRDYVEEGAAHQREQKYINELQSYVTERRISASEMDSVFAWSVGKSVNVVVYQDSDLIYSPEWFQAFDPSLPLPDPLKENDFFESWFSGDRGFEQYLTDEARQKYRDTLDGILKGNQELHPLYLVDGTLLVTFVDYSADVAHNLVLALATVCAIGVVAVIMIFSFSRLSKRVNKLAQDVRLIEGGALDSPIVIEGNDDIMSLARDVDSMRNSLIENMARERHAWESNTALITAMSHDIRTPLTVLMGYLDLIDFSNSSDTNEEYLAICRENVERLKKLSDDMFSYFLVFGKKDVGLKKQSVAVEKEISNMIAEHVFLLREKGYVIECPEDFDGATVCVDVMYISRVIDNIFSNIAKYADPACKITVDTHITNEFAKIRFTNRIRTDKNIPESNRIGLKTCSKIMEQMGGELILEETKDTFCVTVQLTVEAHDDSGTNT
ncbi:MAG: HAMP domain-containing histidine kinase [Ruminococcaceae bacterium]|nr:HAMP domain-containing histidine kinase [Oscillospiraceae bacterium]